VYPETGNFRFLKNSYDFSSLFGHMRRVFVKTLPGFGLASGWRVPE